MTPRDVLRSLRASDPAVAVFGITAGLVITDACATTKSSIFQYDTATVIGDRVDEVFAPPIGECLARVSRQAIEEHRPAAVRALIGGRRYHFNIVPHPATDDDLSAATVIVRPAPRLEIEPSPLAPCEVAPSIDLGPLDRLTRREIEVLALLGEGYSLGEIAEHFDRSIKTVKRFRDGLARKLGIGDRTRLGMIARDLGLEVEDATRPRIRNAGTTTVSLETLTPLLAHAEFPPARDAGNACASRAN